MDRLAAAVKDDVVALHRHEHDQHDGEKDEDVGVEHPVKLLAQLGERPAEQKEAGNVDGDKARRIDDGRQRRDGLDGRGKQDHIDRSDAREVVADTDDGRKHEVRRLAADGGVKEGGGAFVKQKRQREHVVSGREQRDADAQPLHRPPVEMKAPVQYGCAAEGEHEHEDKHPREHAGKAKPKEAAAAERIGEHPLEGEKLNRRAAGDQTDVPDDLPHRSALHVREHALHKFVPFAARDGEHVFADIQIAALYLVDIGEVDQKNSCCSGQRMPPAATFRRPSSSPTRGYRR